ncbi:MAG: cytochrome c-type biogenesis protein CcmH [Betaproteobacteria bacterium]|nr:cytochrome c-type biogenesis protein CcmH [Betaproteobacteria bacterium]MDE2623132.1 cytochrome c-type biogenesis protein CcmH [Betaproteobacteria bacterium]
MKPWLWLLLLCFTWPVHANEAKPLAENEVVEQRLIKIAQEMRCLVCQNESLAGSRADLAEDLRREIRAQIRQGKTDQQVMDFMVSRYGDFVRYRPPVKPTTWLLWFGPFLLLVLGVGALALVLRHRNRAAPDSPLTPEQKKQAEALLRDQP